MLGYFVDPNLPAKDRVAKAIQHWEAETSLRFVAVTTDDIASKPDMDYLCFIPATWCYSYVGRKGGRQDVGLSEGCDVASAIHEIGHAAGLWHEQSREDRDAYVTVHWENITPGWEYAFGQHVTDGDDVGVYDYQSVMHYPRRAFSKNGLDTITAKAPGVTLERAEVLSPGDLAAIRQMYAG